MQSFAAFRGNLHLSQSNVTNPGGRQSHPGVTRQEGLPMALLPPKVIAQVSVRSAGELAETTWEWIMRADGQVLYRLSKVNGRPERNPWTPATWLPAAELEAIRRGHTRATEVLDAIVRQHGHRR